MSCCARPYASTMTIAKGDTLPRMEVEDGSRGLNQAARDYSAPLYVLLAMVWSVVVGVRQHGESDACPCGGEQQREMSVRLGAGRRPMADSAPGFDREPAAFPAPAARLACCFGYSAEPSCPILSPAPGKMSK